MVLRVCYGDYHGPIEGTKWHRKNRPMSSHARRSCRAWGLRPTSCTVSSVRSSLCSHATVEFRRGSHFFSFHSAQYHRVTTAALDCYNITDATQDNSSNEHTLRNNSKQQLSFTPSSSLWLINVILIDTETNSSIWPWHY